VFEDMLIMGSTVPEALPSAPGDIRAYDVKTGALRWSFHTIPHPGEFGYDTWPPDAWKIVGGVNAWSGVTLDAARAMVFVGTGSASYDFYGANRIGDDLFANSVIALDARTGKRIWHYQVLRHDLWDRDLPAAPVLVTVTRDDKPKDAVAQITKTGHVFLFDRETGPLRRSRAIARRRRNTSRSVHLRLRANRSRAAISQCEPLQRTRRP
jgi:quinoprotein glucose dehydrogenase